MKALIILAVAALSLGACKSQEKVIAPAPEPVGNYNAEKYTGELFFTMSRSACFGKCPVYEVSIKPSGEVTFKGEVFVEMIGTYKAQVSEDFLAKIADYAERINYFDLSESYDSPITDIPSTKTQIWMNGKTHSIYNRMGAPQVLNDFEEMCHNMIMEIEGWEAIIEDKQ